MRRLGIAAMVIVAAVALAAVAGAEVKRSGAITVIFNGGISPRKLPRHGTMPVGVQMGGKIKSSDSANPPVLKRIVLDINRAGVIQTRGLGRCGLRKLKVATPAGAKRACANALVGGGSVTSRVSLPEQGAFASIGSLLAFNARYKGRPALFAQVSSGAPLPLTYVIIFKVKKRKGTFGTSLIGILPPIASSYGYISAFNLSLRRTYRFKGRRMSYASAGCPAPKGFNSVTFPMAKVTYIFEEGTSITETLNRECRAKG
jgi:hypothetical protein